MQSPCTRGASQACFHGCCPAPFLSLTEVSNPKPISSVAASRVNFINTTASSLFPNSQFTNHESLPSLSEAFSSFTKAYPQYIETAECDHIRALEYYHLSLFNRVCLDYNGYGLFSHLQHQSFMAAAASSHPPATTNAQFSAAASSSSHPPATSDAQFSFEISYKSASLNSQVLYGGEETAIESAMRKRIMCFLNISENDYRMVFTANQASAFKLLAESYMFQSNRRLLTVYDYESEAVSAMTESSQKRGAKVMSANFSWPGLRIHSAKLKKMVVSNRKKEKKGLFVFPLQSRMTGTRYPYLWMSLAQENGWHVLLDACALGPKDMDTLGLSLFQPDFFVCSFYKVFGENPSGFGCLFVKKSSSSVLEASTMARSIGIVSIVPARKPSQLPNDSSAIDWETKQSKLQSHEDDAAMTSSFSGPLSGPMSNELSIKSMGSDDHQLEGTEHGETSELCVPEVKDKPKGLLSSEIVELENGNSTQLGNTDVNASEMDQNLIECRGLDHADSVGLLLISSRVRFLINWLVFALMKLQHPHSEKGNPLVRIYGPKVRFDRGPAVAFNVFDWKGEKVEPILVQKLADRSNISLGYGVPEHNLHFQVYYKFNNLALLQEPLMLIFGFFIFFVACIVYMHTDMSISKSSASYLAKLQWDEVRATVQQVLSIINRCLTVHDKLEASLHDLSRNGDVQACKAVRKAADALFKEYAKELKPLLGFLQSSPQAAHVWPKVDELVAKEKEMQERSMLKHSSVVECYEKKSGGRDIENRVASHQAKLTALRHEVDDLLEVIDEI